MTDATPRPRDARIRLLSLVGARPQFIKAAILSRVFAQRPVVTEVLIHSGQHYDDNMSAGFFAELQLPPPLVNLEVGSGPHGQQTGRIMERFERVVMEQRPDAIVVYGDTNSTLAGALVGVKLQIPVAHVEAGLRSYRWDIPEEINRWVVDRVSRWCFVPNDRIAGYLYAEGVRGAVHVVGDVMYDQLLYYRAAHPGDGALLARLGVQPQQYLLATIHRPSNTDDREMLRMLLRVLGDAPMPVVFPIHPRTRHAIDESGVTLGKNIRATVPVGYGDLLTLQASACGVLTDSGGVQKEAYWLSVPCLTLRTETEWTETVDAGWNWITGLEEQSIRHAIAEVCEGRFPAAEHRAIRSPLYGDGHAAERMADIVLADLSAGRRE